MGGRRNYQTKKNRRRPRQVHSRLGRGSLRKRITQRKRGGVDPRQMKEMSEIRKGLRKYTPSYFFKKENETTIANDEALAQLGNKDNINLYFGTYHGTNQYLQQYKSFKGRVENGKLAYGEVEFSEPKDLHAPGKCIKYNGPFQQEGDKIGAPGGIIEFPKKEMDQYGDIDLMLPDITCENHASYECILDGFEIIATKGGKGFTGFENLTYFDPEKNYPEKNEDAIFYINKENIVTTFGTNEEAIRDGSGYNVFVYIKKKKTIKFKLKKYKKVFERTCIPGIYIHGTFESAPIYGPVKYAKVFSENMKLLEAEAEKFEKENAKSV